MEPEFNRRFFTFSTGYTVLGAVAGVATPAVINISNKFDFECVYLTGAALQGAAAVFNWPGLVQISDSTMNETWFDQPGGIPAVAVIGTGAQPFPLAYPRVSAGNSTLNVTFFQNVAVATSFNLVLIGNLLIPK